MSHNLTVRSLLAETNNRSSGLKDTLLIRSVCPVKRRISFLVFTSQSLRSKTASPGSAASER
jgi:hypothetical protein